MPDLHTPTSREPRRHLLQWSLLPLLAALIWSGCSQQAQIPADPALIGTYNLVSVDGNSVPCTVKHEGVTMTVKSGTFDINSDGTCRSRIVFAVPPHPDSTREVKARYTCQGAKLTMKWEWAGTTIGTVEGDTFTMNNEGMIFAYHK